MQVKFYYGECGICICSGAVRGINMRNQLNWCSCSGQIIETQIRGEWFCVRY
jgi:hypothetical protein